MKGKMKRVMALALVAVLLLALVASALMPFIQCCSGAERAVSGPFSAPFFTFFNREKVPQPLRPQDFWR